ncbi:type VI secretion system Vgr family protein [Enterobacter asburiae]|uniref:type VI secretion system Vgr family protein n=1 Tax=Enterobacter asburiae TaxID=61645 RepID=UPI0021D2F66D|nr:type VI secretion system tip protein TssI/VgrG [Enterobacter asburiae]MCU6244132.1 type VI secretion system tip protein VgrG [Enterobacter asburiae]
MAEFKKQNFLYYDVPESKKECRPDVEITEKTFFSYRQYFDYSYTPYSFESQGYSDESYRVTLGGNIKESVIPLSLTGEESFFSAFLFTMMVKTTLAWHNMSSYIGDEISVKISVDDDSRYIHGIITNIVQLRADSDFVVRKEGSGSYKYTLYGITIEPTLATLKKSISCHVYRESQAMEVVKTILEKYNISYDDSHLNKKLKSIKKARVQYNYSDYGFIHQLLQEEGVFYFFEHFQDKHEMIFYDDINQFSSCGAKKYDPLPFRRNSLSKFNQIQTLVPSQISLYGYNFQTPEFLSTQEVEVKAQKGAIPHSNIKYTIDSVINNRDYLDSQAACWASRLATESISCSITSYSPSLSTGKAFTLSTNNHKAEGIESEYFINSARINIEQDKCSNNFIYSSILSVYKKGTCWSPPFSISQKTIEGTLSAIVVGKEKESLHTDKYGRVQIRFLWQTEDDPLFETEKYCWARVSQFWSGRDLGSQFLPRVGAEVLVSFLGGNPDCPVIIGCLFNGTYSSPFSLENKETQNCSGIKSHNPVKGSLKTGHQLCFQDQPDEEYVLLHSQRDLTVSADNHADITIKQNMSTTVDVGNHSLEVRKGYHKVNVSEGASTMTARGEIELESTTSITLKVGGSKMVISSEKIQITSPQISVNADGELSLGATEIVKVYGAEIKLN